MSERIQLKNPGDELVMTVTTVSLEDISNTAYVKASDGAREVLVPLSSATRQFERLDITDAKGMVGLTIKFARSTELSKYGKPFWNLDIATPADLKAKAPQKRLSGPNESASADAFAQSLKDDPTGTGEPPEAIDYPVGGREPGEEMESEADVRTRQRHEARQAAAKRYLALWDVVAEHQVAKGKALELPVDGMSVNAACATLWIYFGNKGLVP